MELRQASRNVLEDAGASLKWKHHQQIQHPCKYGKYRTKNNNFLFQPLGDPTVLKFQSRDLDGFLTVRAHIYANKTIEKSQFKTIIGSDHKVVFFVQERVREAVGEWERSGKQFHVGRKEFLSFWKSEFKYFRDKVTIEKNFSHFENRNLSISVT